MQDEEYYRSIGFMCGLELHQRLAVPRKLFCDCPTNIIPASGRSTASITRRQRAIAGELGTVDVSAGFEAQRGRAFIYNVAEGRSCLVEIDEEPPHRINAEAMGTVLAFAKALSMRIVDEIQPMRKGVVDGSDPSAFQRTAMVAFDGHIIVDGNRVDIPSIFLEEESCRAEATHGREITYNVEMLGVPLVEIDTSPYIRTPKEAKDIALYIGTMMRISGMVQRGIGSVRQDVNVSIRGGARVEIKGLQEIEYLDAYIDTEVKRQQELLKIRDELVARKASVGKATDLTSALKGTKVGLISSHAGKGGKALGFRLAGFSGMLGREVAPRRRLGTEISDYAKSAGVGGLIHSDEDLKGYGFSDGDIDRISKKLSLKDGDSFIIIAGGAESSRKAAGFAIERAKYALVGVPPETRGVIGDGTGTTRFLRPLPGGSRMYPETDARPIAVTKKMLSDAESSAPDIKAEEQKLVGQLKDRSLAWRVMLSPRLQTYTSIVQSAKDPTFVAHVLLQKLTELRRAGFSVDGIGDGRLTELFEAYDNGKITKQAVDEILKVLSKRDQDVSSVIEQNKLERISGIPLKELVDEARKKTDNKDQIKKEIMSKHRLNVDGSELNSYLV
ncbi:MAG: Glu-tRNA(Gln) amidotransferase subunit GatE [Candidatus Marsarchaeota archaeon]|jgi:glutamyl-tRNA(Gln) amidotransferase subunit E|nr:Glu-tRNA(Gln) amidotransferase subunit GatE [Candidatus Marsarchaeota archaeon]MCL5111896.1 Glu-tRNA(Gln) amidotransferase subunit GatE [Candidatus Marsarchaeota archaeon]